MTKKTIIDQAWGPAWLVAAFAVAVATEAKWSFSTLGTALFAGGFGLCLGLLSVPVLTYLFVRRHDRIMKAAIDRQFENNEPQIRAAMEEHRSRIELEAVNRLDAAFKECQRTGKPVTIELAGVKEIIYVRPPPDTTGPGRDVN